MDQKSQTQPMQQQQAGSAPLQSHPTQSLPPTVSNTPYPPTPTPTPTPTPQNLPPIVHHPNQFPHHDPYYPPPTQTPETPPNHYQPPPPQAAPPPQPPYQQPQYSQPPPMAQQHPSLSNEEPPPPYLQSHNFPPSNAPPHQFYGNPTQLYEPPSNRPGSGFPSQYGPPSGHNEPYPYGTGSPMKSQPHSAPNMGPSPSSSGAYPQLPTARILPQVLPTASGVGGGSGSGNTENRVPIDDVVDKVTNMGFPRDQVRAIVRKLTENGQAVDLNVVLDKVMNDDGPRGWFGR